MVTINDILLDYSEQRTANLIKEQKRKEEFMSKPGARELVEKRLDLFHKAAAVALRNDTRARELWRDEIQKLNEELCSRFGDNWQEAFEPIYKCPICKDTGYDVSGTRAEMCVCMREKIYRRIYEAEDIKAMPEDFDNYLNGCESIEDKQKDYLLRLKKYAEDICNGTDKNFILLLGGTGLGKSFVMKCMAKRLFNNGEDVLFISAPELFTLFHNIRLGENVPIEPLLSAKYLFIDDLGTEPFTNNVTVETMYRIASGRRKEGLLTVMSTNLMRNEFRGRYGERTYSRMAENGKGVVIEFIGKDLRYAKKRRNV